jgi:hypothetical protein
MDRLNFFNPFRHRPLEYEDVLTRAFFVLMRYDPMALAVFVDLVREALRSRGHPVPPPLSGFRDPATLLTQAQAIEMDAGWVVSILITDRWEDDPPSVEFTDRGHRYDGVLRLDDWTFIVESKPRHEDVDPWQLCPVPPKSGADQLELIPEAVCLTWPEIFDRLQALEERKLLSGLGSIMVGDFLELVDQDHPRLAPFTNFARCHGNLVRLRRRCERIISDVADRLGAETQERVGRSRHVFLEDGVAAELHFSPAQGPSGAWRAVLGLWPADTVGQARRFFSRVQRNSFLALADAGWEVLPYLHFSFMSTHLHWASREGVDATRYFDLWQTGTLSYGGVPVRDSGYLATIESLNGHELLSEHDITELHRHFRDTARNHMNVIPGFMLRYTWSGEEAEELDGAGSMVDRVVERYKEAARTWGSGEPTITSQ